MVESEIVNFNPEVHMDGFLKTYYGWGNWFFNEFKEHSQIDFLAQLGKTIEEWVNDNLEPYISLKPDDGVLLLVRVGDDIAAMGVIHKVGDDVGEIKRMFTNPEHRRKGYARLILNELLKVGREAGCTSFLLDSPVWATASHHLYRSVGFRDIDAYPESEIPVEYQKYWIFMEKKG